MSRSHNKPNYTELTLAVVREAAAPLSFAEIFERVNARAPITTRNPKGTIRSALGQSHSVAPTGDGRYGWKARLVNGSVLRLTLPQSDWRRGIPIGNEVREALWPTFFENQKRKDLAPVKVQLPDGRTAAWPLEGIAGPGSWGTTASPEFWRWFATLGAQAGDHLIVTALDGEARVYAVVFQPRRARDEGAIERRNQAVVQAAVDFLRSKAGSAPLWDITEYLVATGKYRDPVPPDPLDEIWTREAWEPVLQARGEMRMAPLVGGFEFDGSSAGDILEQFLQALDRAARGAGAGDFDVDDPPDLPREYLPGEGRRPRPSRQGRRGPVKTFVLRVNHRALPDVWRDIEIAEDQTLEDLHLAIQQAYEWGDDHLYSFFSTGRAWDQTGEIGSPWSEAPRHTHEVTLAELDLRPRRKLLYVFDYGDGHEFDIRVMRVNPSAPAGQYPRVVASHGEAPEQYPSEDEEWRW